MAGSWYLNIPGFLHLDLVILYINASKRYAATKEVHQYWTMLVTTANNKLKWKNVKYNKRGES